MMRVLTAILLYSLCHFQASAETIVEIDTTMGVMRLELFSDKSPDTVANFLKYVEINYYDDVIFHRVIEDWIIQSGAYDEGLMTRDTMSPVRSEATNGLKNDRGTIAMARMHDPHSADSQFFINLSNNDSLNHRARTFSDYGYTVFGRVIEGLDVADAIGEVETHEVDGFEDIPVEPVFIKTVRIISRDN
jgi:peptidyl-prolyl cis-trans isomerase B (cyclophilin B)